MARCPDCGAEWAEGLFYCPHDGTVLVATLTDDTVDEPLARVRPRPLPLAGEVLGSKYRLDEVIGKGGMGVVYRAEHLRIRRAVAIKILRPEALGDRTRLARFAEEGRLAASIGHDGIVEILDLVTPPEGSPYIVMELLEGETLRERLDRHDPLDPARALKISINVLAALAAAHRRDIVHRDVKPGNIFLARKEGRGEVVKLLDFGIALAAREGFRQTTPGRAIGTARYMPPEQIMGEDVDPRADIYAVAAVTFRMIAGRPPHDGASWGELATSKLTEPAPRLSSLVPGVGPRLDGALASGLAKSREDRPESAEAFSDELAEALVEVRHTRGGLSTDMPTLRMKRRPRIAVLPFEVVSEDPGDTWLAEGLARAITDELVVRPGQRVVPPELVALAVRGTPASGPTGGVWAVGPELGADAIVSGRANCEGASVRVTATVTDLDSGEEADRVELEGTRHTIARVLADAVDSLAAVLGLEPRPGDRDQAMARSDPAAFRQYAELAAAASSAVGDPEAAGALAAQLEWALAEHPEHPGLLRLRAGATLEANALSPRRRDLAQVFEDLESLAGRSYSDSWVPSARTALRLTDAFFNPSEALVLAGEARAVHGPDARVLLEEATALECMGRIDDAIDVLASVLDHGRSCGPALLRLCTLELSPGRVAESSLERAAYLLRGAERLRAEERVEGPRASSMRLGWSALPALWPLEAILAVRRGDGDEAAEILDRAVTEPPGDLVSRLYAFSARDFVASALDLRPDRRDGLLHGLSDRIREILGGPRCHVVQELSVCVPEAWLPVLSARVESQQDDHRVRLLRAIVLRLDGDVEEASREASRLVRSARGTPLASIAATLVEP